MTLNINLEEVPFAILEAVKARILANRRKLQQDQPRPRPSLRPRPQIPKIGASSRTWKMPEDAAMGLGEDSILISWVGIEPRITDPGAQLLFANQANQVASSINGTAAISSGEPLQFAQSRGEAVYQLQKYPRGLSNFTLEMWGQSAGGESLGGSGEGGNSGISMFMEWYVTGVGRNRVEIATNYFPNGLSSFFPILPGFYVGTSGFIGLGSTSQRVDGFNVDNPYHLCIQRIRSNYYYYLNGSLVFTVETAPDQRYAIEDPAYLYVLSDSYDMRAGTKIGQLRLTLNSARYPQAGFTPNPLPFRP